MKHKHLILSLAATAMLCVGCDKDNSTSPKDTSGAASYDEQDWNWNKLPNDGFQIDTAWDDDTTIYF